MLKPLAGKDIYIEAAQLKTSFRDIPALSHRKMPDCSIPTKHWKIVRSRHGSASVGHCQTNLNGLAKGAGLRRSGRQLTPLGQSGGTVLFEDVAAIEVTVLIEMIMD